MTKIIKSNGRVVGFDNLKLINSINEVFDQFENLDSKVFIDKIVNSITAKEEYTTEQITNLLILSALEKIDQQNPQFTYIASNFYLKQLYKQASKNRNYDHKYKYGSLYSLIKILTKKGIYSHELLKKYSKKEIDELSNEIVSERDKLFTYIGLRTLSDRYIARDHDKNVYELPQERFMIIAMHLMKDEKHNRVSLTKEAYWALSNLYMTVATPTLSNAGKSYGQLSSCFIDTVEDDLRSIYDSNTDVANLSKNGGGLGIYLGKIRSRGSDIKGFKGNSSGIIPWMKQINNTAVSVDQLGQRQGAMAVYYDVFGKDILEFLDAKLNNGDERLRTHDIFTGLCIPDIFMEKVEKREDWYVFDPHIVKSVMGFELNDFYDEKFGEGSFRIKYQECVEAANKGLFGEQKKDGYDIIPAIEIVKRIMKSQLETGTPFMFYRDTVNRANPNKHKGMIYCSNLCTEIMQNMSPTQLTQEVIEFEKGEPVIVVRKKPGDFVVCNLSSINLGKAVVEDVLDRLIPIQVRMLDNVIDLNTLNVLQAQITNQRYRAIGLGTFGWHHLLALKGIRWESQESVNYCDSLYEKISFLTIQASCELAKEKGSYPYFKGSEWENKEYFERRAYFSDKWIELSHKVSKNGIRNGYLMAVAPNSSTSIIAGSTASIDPIFKKFYSEEKKNYKIPVTAPNLNAKTTWIYKTAFDIDQHWSVAQNAVRQKHIDQAISFNIYVKNNIHAKDLLAIHINAWKSGLKTTYYVRSTSTEIEDCESCSS